MNIRGLCFQNVAHLIRSHLLFVAFEAHIVACDCIRSFVRWFLSAYVCVHRCCVRRYFRVNVYVHEKTTNAAVNNVIGSKRMRIMHTQY